MRKDQIAELRMHMLVGSSREAEKQRIQAIVSAIVIAVLLCALCVIGEPDHLSECPPGSADVCRAEVTLSD